MRYCDLIIPTANFTKNGVVTYAVPVNLELKIKEGQIVSVSLRNRIVWGLVWQIHDHQPSYPTKNIQKIFQADIFLDEWQLKLIKWMANNYICSLGQVAKLFIPKLLWQGKGREPTTELVSLAKISGNISQFITGKKQKTTILKIEAIINQLKFGEMEIGTLKKILDLKNSRLINELHKLKILKIREGRMMSKKGDHTMTAGFLKNLNSEQEEVLKKCQRATKPVLIHGITGSGKTEIYLHLIYEIVKKGNQAILLLPEIGLTPQLQRYFSRIFGDDLVLWHSRLTVSEKLKSWYKLKRGMAHIVIGSRSAIFCPLTNLGIIIIDEEHEWTYKQDSSPRYHARTVAEKIAELTKAKLILGSATPDITSFHKTQENIFLLGELKNRARTESRGLPCVEMVDLRDEFKARNQSIFSQKLQNKIKEKLERKEQIMLFLNRRGAHSAVICRDCGYVCKCPACEISLTHHQSYENKVGKLLCHHCGVLQSPPELCPNCQSAHIRYIGLGTQRVEEELRNNFPRARIMRADRDTTKSKDDFNKLFQAFNTQEVDILVGTQMITKGFDFPNVTLVGVILGDTELNIPDFRSNEKMFQLLTQVAGRAGRGEKLGEVIIQSYNPDHFVYQYVKKHDFNGFYLAEIKNRQKVNYPPFRALIKLQFSHSDKIKAWQEVQKIKQLLAENNQDLDIYAAPALIPKQFGKYHFRLVIKGSGSRELILQYLDQLQDWQIDMEPVSLC